MNFIPKSKNFCASELKSDSPVWYHISYFVRHPWRLNNTTMHLHYWYFLRYSVSCIYCCSIVQAFNYKETKPCLISNRIRLHFPCGDQDKTGSQYISLDENIINIRALRGISNNTIYSGGNGFVENVTTEEIFSWQKIEKEMIQSWYNVRLATGRHN